MVLSGSYPLAFQKVMSSRGKSGTDRAVSARAAHLVARSLYGGTAWSEHGTVPACLDRRPFEAALDRALQD